MKDRLEPRTVRFTDKEIERILSMPQFKGMDFSKICRHLVSQAIGEMPLTTSEDMLIPEIGLDCFISDIRHMDFSDTISRAKHLAIYTEYPEHFIFLHSHSHSLLERIYRDDGKTTFITKDTSTIPLHFELPVNDKNHVFLRLDKAPFTSFHLMADNELYVSGDWHSSGRIVKHGFKYLHVNESFSIHSHASLIFSGLFLKRIGLMRLNAPVNTEQK